MDEPSAITPGRVLRVWREFAGMTAAELARALPAERSAVTMWEKDQRGRRSGASLATVRQIAGALGLSGSDAAAMVTMWQVASSVDVMAGRPVWFHNFSEPPGPVWVWLRDTRPNGGQPVVLQFGPFDRQFEVPGPSGLLVHSPTSVPNPPLTVTFQDSGWADFGVGTIPAEVAQALGITLVAARDVIGRHDPRTRPLDAEDERSLAPGMALIHNLADRLGIRWSLLRPHFGVLRPSRVAAHALDNATVESTIRPTDAVVDSYGALISQALMSPAQMRVVREARGLSRAAVAQQASALDKEFPVSERALEALEDSGRIPSARHCLARLDMIYRTDGRLGIDRFIDTAVDSNAGKRIILTFPEYWRGHIWLQPRGARPLDTCVVDLRWGPWHRRQRLRSGSVITTRKATPTGPPLIIRLPRGWHLTAGMGVVPTALDINGGWRPANILAALVLIRDNVNAIRRSLRA